MWIDQMKDKKLHMKFRQISRVFYIHGAHKQAWQCIVTVSQRYLQVTVSHADSHWSTSEIHH